MSVVVSNILRRKPTRLSKKYHHDPICAGCGADVWLDSDRGDWIQGVDVCDTCRTSEHVALVDEVRVLRARLRSRR